MYELKLFDEIGNMSKMYDELLDTTFNLKTINTKIPAIEIGKEEDCYKVTAFVPGYKESEISIDIANNMLVITGTKQEEEHNEGYVIEYSEQKHIKKFERKIKLSNFIDKEKVEAELKNGVLNIKLPFSEAEKPKKILIKNN